MWVFWKFLFQHPSGSTRSSQPGTQLRQEEVVLGRAGPCDPAVWDLVNSEPLG